MSSSQPIDGEDETGVSSSHGNVSSDVQQPEDEAGLLSGAGPSSFNNSRPLSAIDSSGFHFSGTASPDSVPLEILSTDSQPGESSIASDHGSNILNFEGITSSIQFDDLDQFGPHSLSEVDMAASIGGASGGFSWDEEMGDIFTFRVSESGSLMHHPEIVDEADGTNMPDSSSSATSKRKTKSSNSKNRPECSSSRLTDQGLQTNRYPPLDFVESSSPLMQLPSFSFEESCSEFDPCTSSSDLMGEKQKSHRPSVTDLKDASERPSTSHEIHNSCILDAAGDKLRNILPSEPIDPDKFLAKSKLIADSDKDKSNDHLELQLRVFTESNHSANASENENSMSSVNASSRPTHGLQVDIDHNPPTVAPRGIVGMAHCFPSDILKTISPPKGSATIMSQPQPMDAQLAEISSLASETSVAERESSETVARSDALPVREAVLDVNLSLEHVRNPAEADGPPILEGALVTDNEDSLTLNNIGNVSSTEEQHSVSHLGSGLAGREVNSAGSQSAVKSKKRKNSTACEATPSTSNSSSASLASSRETIHTAPSQAGLKDPTIEPSSEKTVTSSADHTRTVDSPKLTSTSPVTSAIDHVDQFDLLPDIQSSCSSSLSKKNVIPSKVAVAVEGCSHTDPVKDGPSLSSRLSISSDNTSTSKKSMVAQKRSSNAALNRSGVSDAAAGNADTAVIQTVHPAPTNDGAKDGNGFSGSGPIRLQVDEPPGPSSHASRPTNPQTHSRPSSTPSRKVSQAPQEDSLENSSKRDATQGSQKDTHCPDVHEMRQPQSSQRDVSGTSSTPKDSILNDPEEEENTFYPITHQVREPPCSQRDVPGTSGTSTDVIFLDDPEEQNTPLGDMEVVDIYAISSEDEDGEIVEDSDMINSEIDDLLEQDLQTEYAGKGKKRGADGELRADNGHASLKGDMVEPTLEEKEKGIYSVTKKRRFVRRGRDPLEGIPKDWIAIQHRSGLEVYMHRPSRVCTWSRPYSIGTGSARKHSVPLAAIRCLHYKRAKEEETGSKGTESNKRQCLQPESGGSKDSMVNGNEDGSKPPCDGGGDAPPIAESDSAALAATAENAPSCSASGEEGAKVSDTTTRLKNKLRFEPDEALTPEELHEYAKKLFDFKDVSVRKFMTWADRRNFWKEEKLKQQGKGEAEKDNVDRPKLPIVPTFEADAQSNEGEMPSKKKDRTIGMIEKTPVSILHEYCQRVLKIHPKYTIVERHNCNLPFEAAVLIDGQQYGRGVGASKKIARKNAARETLKILIPNVISQTEEQSYVGSVEFFDQVPIDDPRVSDLCMKTGNLTPYLILHDCKQRMFGKAGTEFSYNVTVNSHNRVTYHMSLGPHTATGVCKNAKIGKQLGAQKILQQIYPKVKTWGGIIRMHGRGVDEIVHAKKEKEKEIFALSKEQLNKPKEMVLAKLKEEMKKAYAAKMQATEQGQQLPSTTPSTSSS